MDLVDGHQIRRCLFCKGKAKKGRLWRFVVDRNGCLIWDQRQVLPGRGAYMHPSWACWERSAESARWAKALRVGRASIERGLLELRSQLRPLLPDRTNRVSAAARMRL